MRLKYIITSYKLLFLIVIILVFILSVLDYPLLKDKIAGLVSSYGFLALFVISFSMEIVPQYLSPHLALIIAYFSKMNLLLALFVVLIGSTTGSVLAFTLGRAYGDSLVYKFIDESSVFKFKKVINEHGKWYVLVAALSPLPYIPLILGMLKMSNKIFLLYGIIPRMIGIVIVSIAIYLGFY